MHDALFARIEAKRDDLVALTRDLIRFPTVNPPGEAYTPCAEFLGARLEARGFDVGYHRAEGERGDSARYPRTNVVARREGGRRSEEHTSELQSLMRISYAVFCLKKKKQHDNNSNNSMITTA